MTPTTSERAGSTGSRPAGPATEAAERCLARSDLAESDLAESDRAHVADIVARIERVLDRDGAPVALHEPRFAGNEKRYLADCIDTGWVSYAGPYVARFEAALAATCGVRHAIAVANGTVALEMALRLAGVERGDEVIIPDLTFVASANAVAHCGAIPHLADSGEASLGLDPDKLARHLDAIAETSGGACCNRLTGRRIAAVMPMHTFGHPVDMDTLAEVAARWRLAIVEDAAESLGSTYRGAPVGRHGRLAAVSFNGNKIVTTGGGGAILTDDDGLARRARHITTTAKLPHRWEFVHDEVGYNFRLPSINAAVGLAQIEQLPEFLAAKRRLAARYRAAFAGCNAARIHDDQPWACSNAWLVPLLLQPDLAHLRDPLLTATNDNGIMTRPAWRLMHRLPMFAACPRMDVSVAEGLEARLISLPSSVKHGLAA